MRRLKPDLVHTHSSKAGILGRMAAARESVPMIVHTVHGWGFHDMQAWPTRTAYQILERRAARITDRLVVVANANREKGLAAGIGRPDQYVTIRSGIAIDAERLRGERAAMRNRLGISEDAFLVAAIGNFKAQKAPEAMGRIAHDLLEKRPAVHFVAAGDGPGRGGLERMLASECREGRAHILGWRPDATGILACADALLHTALFEGLPRVVLEAMALGVPVVSTDVDGIPEAVRDGVTGFLFAPGEEGAMARALVQLNDDQLLRRDMSAAARANFGAEFTLAKMLDDLDELYEEIAREKRSIVSR